MPAVRVDYFLGGVYPARCRCRRRGKGHCRVVEGVAAFCNLGKTVPRQTMYPAIANEMRLTARIKTAASQA